MKSVIQNLQTQVSDLQPQVGRLETKLEADAVDPANVQRPTTEVIPLAIHGNVEHAETAETTAEINIRDNDSNETRNDGGDNFRLPTPQQRRVVNGRFGTPSSNPGIRGTSTDPMTFSGVSKQNTSNIRSDYIGNAGLNTSIKLIRDHLASIGLSTDIVDVQLLTIKNKDSKSFCVTLSSVDTENKAYTSRCPANVVVRPYHVPRPKNATHKRNTHRNNNTEYSKSRNNPMNYKPQWQPQQHKQQQHNTNKIEKQHYHQMPPMPTYYMPPAHKSSGGIYPGYNGQFLPLMGLPINV